MTTAACLLVSLGISVSVMVGCAGTDVSSASGTSVGQGTLGVAEPRGASTPTAPTLFPVRCDNKWGFIDNAGQVVIGFQYDEAHEFSDGMAGVRVSDEWGYIDETGSMVIAPQWYAAGSFEGGLAPVKSRNTAVTTDVVNNVRYVDKTGQVVIAADPRWSDASEFSEGLAAVWFLGGGCGYIDTSGRQVLLFPEATALRRFSEGLAAVRDSANRWGYIDANGEFVIEPQFKYAGEFSNGLAVVEYKEEYEVISKTGRVLKVLDYDYVMGLHEGRAAVRGGGLADVGEEGRDTWTAESAWGYMDEMGARVIAPGFGFGGDFSGGLARVSDKSGKMGYIDRSGNYVWREK